jgi:hypothetical protein
MIRVHRRVHELRLDDLRDPFRSDLSPDDRPLSTGVGRRDDDGLRLIGSNVRRRKLKSLAIHRVPAQTQPIWRPSVDYSTVDGNRDLA